MRMIMQVRFPNEPFNTMVRNGTASEKMKQILDGLKPEAAWFYEWEGQRSGILIVDMKESSQIPSIAEPWFLNFDAAVHLRPAMSLEDLAKSGLDTLGKKWA